MTNKSIKIILNRPKGGIKSVAVNPFFGVLLITVATLATPSQREGFFMEKSYIKLFRNILQWSWYSDTPTFRVFIHLLLTANFADKKWRNIIIKRGQKVISYRKLAKSLNLSIQQIRTAISHLKSTHEITQLSTHQYTIIQVQNYDKYQSINTVSNTVSNTRPTQSYIYKNDNKKDNNKTPLPPTDKILPLSQWQVEGLLKEFPIFSIEEINQEAIHCRTRIELSTTTIRHPFQFFKSQLEIAAKEKNQTEGMNRVAEQTIDLPELSGEERARNRERLAEMRKALREKFLV